MIKTYGDIPVGTIVKNTYKNTEYGFSISKVVEKQNYQYKVVLEMLYNSDNSLLYNNVYLRDEVLSDTIEIIADSYEECLQKYPELFL